MLNLLSHPKSEYKYYSLFTTDHILVLSKDLFSMDELGDIQKKMQQVFKDNFALLTTRNSYPLFRQNFTICNNPRNRLCTKDTNIIESSHNNDEIIYIACATEDDLILSKMLLQEYI